MVALHPTVDQGGQFVARPDGTEDRLDWFARGGGKLGLYDLEGEEFWLHVVLPVAAGAKPEDLHAPYRTRTTWTGNWPGRIRFANLKWRPYNRGDMLRRLVAIVGPTASGKSAVALELAGRLGGEIVNADSRQVYRGMEIGTAKPTADERRRLRHHLFDIRDPGEAYSLALYQRDARAALEAIWERDSFAWLVGGTGQYVWALLESWTVPEVAPDVPLRDELTAFAEANGVDALHARLAAVDPTAAASIDARNVRRVVRAIEVHQLTGRPISAWQTKGAPDFEYLLFGIDVPRDVLDGRIDRRVDGMFAGGFVDEVRTLLATGIRADAAAMSSIGYGQVARHLGGEISLAEAIDETKRATRRLARRQAQWFRRDDRRITWVEDADDIDLQANIFTGACTNVIRGEGRR